MDTRLSKNERALKAGKKLKNNRFNIGKKKIKFGLRKRK